MGMIGNTLAQGLISGANIVDGTVDTVDIKDAAVTPAKLSAGKPVWDASGNVGIGTSSPVALLDVRSATGQASVIIAGGTDRGNLNLTTGADDASGISVGTVAWQGGASTSGGGESRIALISAATEGATANNRGGFINFNTKVNNGALAERMRIDSSGNVGIGANAPEQRLHVRSGSGSGSIQLGGYASDGYYGRVQQSANSLNIISNGDQAYRVSLGTNDGSGQIRFLTANGTTGDTQRMVITAAGSVGIGRDPNANFSLDVGNTLYADMLTTNAAGVIGNNLYFGSGTWRYASNGHAYGWNQTSTNASILTLQHAGNNTSGAGAVASISERMRVTSHGNFQIGTSGYNSSTNSRLFVAGAQAGSWGERILTLEHSTQPAIGFHAPGNSAAGVFKFWGASTQFECRNSTDTAFIPILASAFPVSSDYRIKTDVVEVQSALQGVLSLRPVNYIKEGVRGREHGLIAHEVSPHFPDLVRGEKDAMRSANEIETQTLDYTGLTSVLVKAIQEQQAIITALTARVAALEGTQ